MSGGMFLTESGAKAGLKTYYHGGAAPAACKSIIVQSAQQPQDYFFKFRILCKFIAVFPAV